MSELFIRLDIQGTIVRIDGRPIHPDDAFKMARDLTAMLAVHGMELHGSIVGRTSRGLTDHGQHDRDVYRASTGGLVKGVDEPAREISPTSERPWFSHADGSRCPGVRVSRPTIEQVAGMAFARSSPSTHLDEHEEHVKALHTDVFTEREGA